MILGFGKGGVENSQVLVQSCNGGLGRGSKTESLFKGQALLKESLTTLS